MRALSEKMAAACENATSKRCKCRCRGACHGQARAVDRDGFEALPADDPHHLKTPDEKKVPLVTPFPATIEMPSAKQPLVVRQHSYMSGGGVAYRLYTQDGEPWMTLSVNVEGAKLAPGEFCVKDYAENEPFIPDVLKSGLFEDTGRRVLTGFVEVPVWRTK